jgi:hypothetical protein
MSPAEQWKDINTRHLTAMVTWVRLRLQKLAPPPKVKEKRGSSWFRKEEPQGLEENVGPKKATDKEIAKAQQAMTELEGAQPPPALILLGERLGLTSFDRHVLALCAAMELDTRIAPLCARVHDDPNKAYPTFALAFALFDDPDWSALSPQGALRHWRLLEITQPDGRPLTAAALRADERIVNYLKGLNYLDDRLNPLMDPMEAPLLNAALPPSQQRRVDQILRRLNQTAPHERPPIVELLGRDSVSKRLVASQVAQPMGLSLQSMDIKSLPAQNVDFETFTRLWQRETLLLPIGLYIYVNDAGGADTSLLNRFLDKNQSFVFIDRQDPIDDALRHRAVFEIAKPIPEEQARLWQEALQDRSETSTARLAEQFSFNQTEIRRLAATLLAEYPAGQPVPEAALWKACREAARADMDQLAQRIDAKATWARLVLPAEQTSLLRRITEQVHQRSRVYEAWGFREVMNRGLGINALFAGESGTGKTMAAEVIANELNLDLYRIDLSAVVNKYIGETEKNLRRLFEAAEESGAILFFDEADALFGKRSEVKDSHDRYANIEINYLLQRMESYRGLAILATNMKSALDKAFMRRLRFIVEFPLPSVAERRQIWQKIFPEQTPLADKLDYAYLARLNLNGGGINNVALNAAFQAAQAGSPVTMAMLLDAARTELKKLERPLKETDFRWQDQVKGVA